MAVVDETASETEHRSLTALAADARSLPLRGREAGQQRGSRGARTGQLIQYDCRILQVVGPVLGKGVEVSRRELGRLLVQDAVDALGIEVDDVAHVGGVLKG